MTLVQRAFLLLCIVVVFGGLLLAAKFVPLPIRMERHRDVLLVGALGVGVLLCMAGGGLWASRIEKERTRVLDAAFLPAGLSGQRYQLVGRQYQGEVRGRRVSVLFYRGPTLEVLVAGASRVSMAIGTENVMASQLNLAMGRSSLPMNELGLPQLLAFSKDEQQARAVLTQPAVQALLRGLLQRTGDNVLEQRQLHTDGAGILFRVQVIDAARITQDQVQRWLDDLQRLLALVE